MGKLVMSKRERRRVEVLSQVQAENLTLQKAAELLGLGYRQVRRVWKRYQASGDAGLVHGLRHPRQQSPLTAGARDVENAIRDTPHVHAPIRADWRTGRQPAPDSMPLLGGHVVG